MSQQRNKLNNRGAGDSEKQLLKPEAEEYLRESANIEDMPDAEDIADAEEVEQKDKREGSEETITE